MKPSSGLRATALIDDPQGSSRPDPAENIYAWPGDVLTLVRIPQTFSVFGATGQYNQVNFNAEKVTLAEALAKAGGLQDLRADPAGAFLFRFELPDVVGALKAPALATGPGGTSPILDRLDLSDANSYFFPDGFPSRTKIIDVANARLNELQNFSRFEHDHWSGDHRNCRKGIGVAMTGHGPVGNSFRES